MDLLIGIGISLLMAGTALFIIFAMFASIIILVRLAEKRGWLE